MSPTAVPTDEEVERLSHEVDEDWEYNGDAAHGRLDPPAAAASYTPRERTVCTSTRSTTTTTTGGAMSSIGDAAGAVMSAHETGQGALHAISQAHEMVGDARNELWQATEGSNQTEADQARAQLTEAMNKLEEAEQLVAGSLQEFEGVAQRL